MNLRAFYYLHKDIFFTVALLYDAEIHITHASDNNKNGYQNPFFSSSSLAGRLQKDKLQVQQCTDFKGVGIFARTLWYTKKYVYNWTSLALRQSSFGHFESLFGHWLPIYWRHLKQLRSNSFGHLWFYHFITEIIFQEWFEK